AEAGADLGLEGVGGAVRIAGVDEGRNAPVAREVILVLRAQHCDVLAADHVVGVVARTDRLVRIAADRTITAGEEAQFRRQLVEVVYLGCAERAARDETRFAA